MDVTAQSFATSLLRRCSRRSAKRAKHQPRRGAKRSVVRPVATPLRGERWVTAPVCAACGWTPCACSFLEMDPFHPVSAVLALTPLAPAPLRPDASSVAAFAELELSGLEQTLEQTLELRMAKRDGKDLVWPFSLKVLLDGVEIAQVDPPREGKRQDAPLQLPLQRQAKSMRHDLQLLAWDAPIGTDWHAARDLVLCVVRTRSRSVAELCDECRHRPSISRQRSLELLLGRSSVQATGEVMCETPWLQPLRCPLTMERLKEPVRGLHCKHLQCVELEAFLITASSRCFQRRWRCPICDTLLPPKQLARCELTRSLLQHLPPSVQASPIDVVPEACSCDACEKDRCARARSGGWGRRLRCEVQQWGELD
ncbi:unnamed protein product [Durusdinium trenchii]|uniref:Zinc finger MIZ domain-containing protein 1 (PIAS-like protein Zimp10) (Retinoic acid-induced protein 17) n=2 Tax=Durusdinium trenchii TaxID=1381693 RepID=A0ABP0JAL1_9DINO